MPCWYGLEPGVSSREDLIGRAEQLPFIDGKSEKLISLKGAEFQYEKPQGTSFIGGAFEKNCR